MNYWMCDYARQKGFQCADNFAQYMGADYDSNGDGQIDSDALRYVAGESEASYVTRITSTLRSTMRDANTHFVSVEQQLRLHPVRRHPPDLHRRHRHGRPVRRHHRLGRAALHLVHRRQEPDLEPVRSRAHGLGAVDLQPGGALTRRGSTIPCMTSRAVPARRRPDPVAGSRTWRPSLGYLAIALVIAAGGLAYWLMSSPSPDARRRRHRSHRPRRRLAASSSTAARR